ncbi:MAG: FUSC family protein [Methylacidiphilales bacterium]|nr:FUSC family protein [Candidatus Methylacidiphilales bacterium]
MSWLATSWREVLSLLQFRFMPEKKREALAFAIRGWVASMLAMYLAFYLELDEPYWAPLTVWIVLQPTPGMSISKAFYRIVGTIIGSFMGVVLICFFVQTPELFIAALALWVGACTMVSNLLRNFRAYGAVMAGFTAAIVASGAIERPNEIIQIALARCAATLIGIACATIITAIFAKHEARTRVRMLLAKAIGDTIRRSALPVTATTAERLALGKPLIDELIALDAEIDYAAAESAGVRIHEDCARSLVAHLFQAIAARRSLEEELPRGGTSADPEVAQLLDSTLQFFRNAPELMAADQWLTLQQQMEELRRKIEKAMPEERVSDFRPAASSRMVLDRLDELLEHLARAISDWQLLLGGWKWSPSLSLNFHRDRRRAVINGLRAAIAVGVAGAFWIASAWSMGPSLLIWVSVGASFFASAPQPDRLGNLFLNLVMVACVAAFIVNYFVLPGTSAFPILAFAYGLVLVPATVLLYNARNPIPIMAFCANFIALSQPVNAMTYDTAAFLNNAMALYLGCGAGVLSYSLFMPADPRVARRYVVYRIRLGLERISRLEPIPSFDVWQTRMFDRINRLHDPANPSGWPTDEWFNGGLAALGLGTEVLRLRHLLTEARLASRTAGLIRTVLQSFREITARPDVARKSVRHALTELERNVPEGREEKLSWFRVRGILEKMESFFADHPTFLTGRTEMI